MKWNKATTWKQFINWNGNKHRVCQKEAIWYCWCWDNIVPWVSHVPIPKGRCWDDVVIRAFMFQGLVLYLKWMIMAIVTVISSFDTNKVSGSNFIVLIQKPHLHAAVKKKSLPAGSTIIATIMWVKFLYFLLCFWGILLARVYFLTGES